MGHNIPGLMGVAKLSNPHASVFWTGELDTPLPTLLAFPTLKLISSITKSDHLITLMSFDMVLMIVLDHMNIKTMSSYKHGIPTYYQLLHIL
jgi:hypothetical protein